MSDETENMQQPERLSISMTQIIASVLAAVSASVAASYFGVAGTVIGAALGSIVSVVGGAIYAHSITRTRDRLRRTAVEDAVRQRFDVTEPRARWLAPKQIAIAASALFVIAIGTVTGLELLTGEPVSSAVGGTSQSGTSLFGATDRHSQQPTTTSSTPVESTPASRPTTTVTVTQTPSGTSTTPTPSSTPSTTVTPTGWTSSTPSATTTPSTSPSP